MSELLAIVEAPLERSQPPDPVAGEQRIANACGSVLIARLPAADSGLSFTTGAAEKGLETCERLELPGDPQTLDGRQDVQCEKAAAIITATDNNDFLVGVSGSTRVHKFNQVHRYI